MTPTGILLAAGRGTRLLPLTEIVPKAAVPVLDLPLGAWPLTGLLEACPEVVVNVSRYAAGVGGALEPWAPGRLRIFDEGHEPLGTAGTLKALAGEGIRSAVVANADVITDLSPVRLLEAHAHGGAPATVAVAPVEAGADLEVTNGRAIRFLDRRVERARPGAVFMGMAVIEASVLGAIPNRVPLGFGEAVLRPLAERGELEVLVHGGYWLDVGEIHRYLQAARDVLSGTAPRPGGLTPPGDIIDVDRGRAYVGPGTMVEEASLGPGAVVLARATVGSGARVADAIVWPGEEVPAGVVVEGAVWAGGRAVRARGGG